MELRDRAAPRGAGGGGLGGRVEVVCQGLSQRRWLLGGGYQSASAVQGSFGLPAGATVASVRITWPDGHQQGLSDVSVNQRLVVGRD